MRMVGVVLALVLVMASSAYAMPGDPPVSPSTPDDGATLPVSADGIPVTFPCPLYRVADDGVLPDLRRGVATGASSFATRQRARCGRTPSQPGLAGAGRALDARRDVLRRHERGRRASARRRRRAPTTGRSGGSARVPGIRLRGRADPDADADLGRQAGPEAAVEGLRRVSVHRHRAAATACRTSPRSASSASARLVGRTVGTDTIASGTSEVTLKLPKGAQKLRASLHRRLTDRLLGGGERSPSTSGGEGQKASRASTRARSAAGRRARRSRSRAARCAPSPRTSR